MRLFGIASSLFILFGALFLVRRYKSFCKERIEAGQAMLDFIKFRGENIRRFSSPKSEICRRFRSPVFEESGFLSSLMAGKSYADAFMDAKEKLPLSATACELIFGAFKGMGSGYLDEEKARQKAIEDELEDFFGKEKEELQRDIKVKTTLILSAALGAAILLI